MEIEEKKLKEIFNEIEKIKKQLNKIEELKSNLENFESDNPEEYEKIENKMINIKKEENDIFKIFNEIITIFNEEINNLDNSDNLNNLDNNTIKNLEFVKDNLTKSLNKINNLIKNNS